MPLFALTQWYVSEPSTTAQLASSTMATNWTIRRAVAADVDALTWIAIHAFPHDPQWIYRYPHAQEYPEDHQKYTKLRYREWLAANDGPHCIIMVAECPILEDPRVNKVAALSIWRIPNRRGGDGEEDREKSACVG